jgi:predicted kinase
MSQLDKEKRINEVTQIVINKVIKEHFSSNKIIFVCGPMGSGKTTYIKHNLLQSKMYYYHSIDELIPYFIDIESDPRKMYQLCRSVGIKVTDFLLEKNISMIIEGTGKNMDMVDYLKRLKQSGYNIRTIFITTDLKTCRERVKIRNTQQKHQVLDEDIIEYYKILWDQDKNMSKIISEVSNDVEFVDNYSIH